MIVKIFIKQEASGINRISVMDSSFNLVKLLEDLIGKISRKMMALRLVVR